MTVDPPPDHLDPAQPGPFVKYLFSGACYVRIAECYKLYRKMLGARVDERDRESARQALSAELLEAWQAYLGALNLAGVSTADSNPQGSYPWQGLNREIHGSGRAAMVTFSEAVARDREALDFQSFFNHWLRSCEDAHSALIRSDAFGQALGQSVKMLHLSAAATDTKPKD